MIQVNDKTIETDEEGYLLNPDDWDEAVAEAIAAQEGLKLTDAHWGMIYYFREYYEEHMRHPSMHVFLKTLGRRHGKRYRDTGAYREFLYRLFPKGPVQMVCKLAGLPKPLDEIEE
ncbi:TusE/DsrC/DsvC family sulfur relay protein [Thiolapillus sp.]